MKKIKYFVAIVLTTFFLFGIARSGHASMDANDYVKKNLDVLINPLADPVKKKMIIAIVDTIVFLRKNNLYFYPSEVIDMVNNKMVIYKLSSNKNKGYWIYQFFDNLSGRGTYLIRYKTLIGKNIDVGMVKDINSISGIIKKHKNERKNAMP